MENNLFCDYCEYRTNRGNNFKKHLNSNKHKKNILLQEHNLLKQNLVDNTNSDSLFQKNCICGKTFLHNSSLYRHKKICLEYINNCNSNNLLLEDTLLDNDVENKIIQILVEQLNKKDEHIKKLVDGLIDIKQTLAQPQITNNTINNTKINNNNTNVMGVFLGNYCKNAINMSDFMKSMEIQLSDLLHTRDHGIIKGITNIFMNRLKELDIYERPIHCTDIKRLTMYVKDDDMWYEGESGKQKISDTIQNISALQIKKIPDWEAVYSKKLNKEDLDDQYIRIVNNTNKNVGEKEEEKILRAIAKDVTINKKSLEIEN